MKEKHNSEIRRFLLFIIIAISLNICSLYVFLRGFLPLKTRTDRYATLDGIYNYSSELYGSGSDRKQVYKASVDRLVLIIIDALRADFIPSVKPGFFHQTTMPYTEGFIRSGKALSFISKCYSPTVTLPRIKSILTGSIPSFADLIFNLNAGSLAQDSFIGQATTLNKKVVFYGDDTWIKLFPNHFFRQDGTTSFFVSDYTEVDQNVSRHLNEELKLIDWDIMILHYLGIDHIGHLAGPDSPLLLPKLLEMDAIIGKIHEALIRTNRNRSLSDLIVITGDHGMGIGGNHGGVSPAEVLTPLIILSTNTDHVFQVQSREVLQIDIATTLSVALGLPIPASNYGCLIKEVMNMTHMPIEQQLFSLYCNSMQLSELIGEADISLSSHHFAEGIKYHKNWLSLKTKGTSTSETSFLAQQIMEKYANHSDILSKKLISTVEKYDTGAMIIAIIISWQVVIFLFSYITALPNEHFTFSKLNFTYAEIAALLLVSFSIIAYLFITYSNLLGYSMWTTVSDIIIIISSSALFVKSISVARKTSLIASILSSQTNLFLVFGTAIYTISLLSSSFIEEEHQTWYFVTTSYYILGISCLKFSDNISAVPKCSCQVFSYTVQKSSEQFLPILRNHPSDQKKSLKHAAYFSNIKFLSGLGLITISRILRSWNQTGIKWAHLSDIGDFLNLPENKLLLTSSVILSVIFIILLIAYDREILQSGCLAMCILCIYVYRVSTKQLVFFVEIGEFDGTFAMRVLYVGLFIIISFRLCIFYYKIYCKSLLDYEIVINKFNLLSHFIQSWVIFSAALHRPHNIPLLAGIILQEYLVSKILQNKSTETLAIVYSWMAMCSFFYQGNSNSLATIDVSAGYLGLSSYNTVLVGILIACNTYSGMLFWLLMLAFRVLERIVSLRCDCSIGQMIIHIRKCVCAILCMRYLSSALYFVVIVILRYHLFIWTVFAPKLLYEGAHNVVFSLYVIFVLLLSYPNF